MIPFLLSTFFASAPPPSLRVSMISLGVSNMSRSVAFYEETLGLKRLGPAGEVTQFQAGDIILVLNHPAGRAAGGRLSGSVEIIFPVGSVVKAHAAYSERGCQFRTPPREVTPGLWAATFADPDGHLLTLLGDR